MKLALYLPNFRNKVTVKELEDLTSLAEELDFDSVLDARPDRRSRGLRPRGTPVLVRHDARVPEGAAGVLPRSVVPGLAADPLAGREDVEGADRHEHLRHAVPCARCPRRGARHGGPPLQRQAQRGRGGRLDARGVPEQGGRQLLLGRPIFVEDSPFIRSITERHWLPPSSLPRCLISFLCSQPSLAGRQRGYFVHLLDHSGVRSCLSTGGASSATGDIAAPVPDHVPFWFKPDSIFGLSFLTAFISTSPGLT